MTTLKEKGLLILTNGKGETFYESYAIFEAENELDTEYFVSTDNYYQNEYTLRYKNSIWALTKKFISKSEAEYVLSECIEKYLIQKDKSDKENIVNRTKEILYDKR